MRGHRPTAGKLDLVDGPFLQVALAARNDLDNKYVVVIEEINRGNPAQIFGEMLTLLESDKRNEDEGMALAIPRAANERVHIPPNVYVIGTMNVADRSLALVDLALRRRFTFVDLEPTFGDPWRRWMHEQGGVDDNHLRRIEQRVTRQHRSAADRTTATTSTRAGRLPVRASNGRHTPQPFRTRRFATVDEVGTETRIGVPMHCGECASGTRRSKLGSGARPSSRTQCRCRGAAGTSAPRGSKNDGRR